MADLLELSRRVIDEGAAAAVGPINRINHELSEIGNGLAVVEAFSHCVLFDTDDGLLAFDTSGVAGGERVMEALRAVTIDAAWQVFQDDNRGSLEPGKYADLVVLSGNPVDDPMGLRELQVERTLVGGATIYRRQ